MDPTILDQIDAILESRVGLVFPPVRRPLLARAVMACATELGLDPARDVDRLTEPGSPAWRRLISHATVGETYFFRHRDQLDAFRDIALAPLIRARQTCARPTLRFWSAGCATGEEAYTLAMLVEESLPDPARWDVRVLGTDIDAAALERARTGLYRRWSFRVDADYRRRWFERAEGGERVRDEIRRRVVFEEDNLVDPAAVPPLALDGRADAIVCRNVAMYMSPAAARRVADRLYDALAPGGWLLVGPVEPSAEVYRRFVSRQHDGLTFYQRPAAGSTVGPVAPTVSPSPAPGARVSPPPALTPERRSWAPRTQPVPDGAQPASPSPSAPPQALLADARALADAGDLVEAERRCRESLAIDARTADGYVLLATILDARGDLDEACHTLGRAVYLRHDDPLTQFQLGLLEWRRGRTAQARARLGAALRLTADRDDSEPIGGPGGLTVGRVRSVIGCLEM